MIEDKSGKLTEKTKYPITIKHLTVELGNYQKGGILRVPYLLLIMVVVLSGCATMSREQCQSGDWYNIGIANGREGKTLARLDKIQQDCREHQVKIDSQRYLEGYALGLTKYCQIDNAFDTGLNEHIYQHVCPLAIDAIFNHYNEAAREVRSIEGTIINLEMDLGDERSLLYDEKLSVSQRNEIESNIRDIELDIYKSQRELQSSRATLARLMEEAGYKKGPQNATPTGDSNSLSSLEYAKLFAYFKQTGDQAKMFEAMLKARYRWLYERVCFPAIEKDGPDSPSVFMSAFLFSSSRELSTMESQPQQYSEVLARLLFWQVAPRQRNKYQPGYPHHQVSEAVCDRHTQDLQRIYTKTIEKKHSLMSNKEYQKLVSRIAAYEKLSATEKIAREKEYLRAIQRKSELEGEYDPE